MSIRRKGEKKILYSKEGLLLLVQIDHLNGEIIGDVIERLYGAGAKNVQVISGITKKNRPSYVILIDIKKEQAEAAEEIIIRECASSGWHRIETCHRHTDVSVLAKDVIIHTKKDIYSFQVKGKVINNDVKNVRPEYENCVELKNFLLEKENIQISVRQAAACIEKVFQENKTQMIF